MRKYWCKCRLVNGDDMVIVTKAADPEYAAIQAIVYYKVDDVIEVQDHPYITQQDFLKDGLHRVCKNNLRSYKYRSRVVND